MVNAGEELGADFESIFDYLCRKGYVISKDPSITTYTLPGIVSLNVRFLSVFLDFVLYQIYSR